MSRLPYRIDFLTNTITVSKTFLMEASKLGSEAYKTMMSLRTLGMTIVQEKHKKP